MFTTGEHPRPVPATFPFWASLSASLACSALRQLTGFRICCPYHSILAPNRIDARSTIVLSRFQCQPCGCGFIVPGASYRRITLAACPGRILLVKQQVSLQLALPRQSLGRLHVARVPCWYSTPSLSGWSRACVSNLTSSWLIAFTGQSRSRRRTHVTALQMRLSNDGGSVPFFLRRLSKRGW